MSSLLCAKDLNDDRKELYGDEIDQRRIFDMVKTKNIPMYVLLIGHRLLVWVYKIQIS